VVVVNKFDCTKQIAGRPCHDKNISTRENNSLNMILKIDLAPVQRENEDSNSILNFD
jgi:hypothetical protein